MTTDRRTADQVLLDRIKASLPALDALLERVNDHWCGEDLVYRFYHRSFKVYGLQGYTSKILDALEALRFEDIQLNGYFLEITQAGLGHAFDLSHNEDWAKHTRPIVEAFFHAKFFLEMVCKYGHQLYEAPQLLPSGWAAVLELYRIR